MCVYHFDNVDTGILYLITETEVNFLLIKKPSSVGQLYLIIELQIAAKVLPNLELNKVFCL